MPIISSYGIDSLSNKYTYILYITRQSYLLALIFFSSYTNSVAVRVAEERTECVRLI